MIQVGVLLGVVIVLEICQMDAKMFTLPWFPFVLNHIKGYEIHKEPGYSQLFASVFIYL